MSCRLLLSRLGGRSVHAQRRMVSHLVLSSVAMMLPMRLCNVSGEVCTSFLAREGNANAEEKGSCPTCAMPRRNALQCLQICLRGPLANPVEHLYSQNASVTAQATQASAAPSYHVLQYKYIPDILEKRGPFREKHLALAGQKVNGYSIPTLLLLLSMDFVCCSMLVYRCLLLLKTLYNCREIKAR